MGWHVKPLGEVVTLQRGFDLPKQDRQPGTVPIVSSSGVSGSHSKSRVSAPGVVTGRYGSIGRVHFIETDFWPLNTTLFVKDFKGNDPRFVAYLLGTIDYASCSDKSSVPGVNRNDLHRLSVAVPDLPEQRYIAETLGALDDKIELNRRMRRTLESIARAIFKSWFVDFDPVRRKMIGCEVRPPESIARLFPDSLCDSELGEIPQGWRVGAILDVARLLSGGTPKTGRPEYWNGGIPWASAKDVSQSDASFLIDTDRTVSKRGLEESATQLISALCSVVVARGATTGRMVILGEAMAMNQTCYALSSRLGTPLALYCHLRHEIDNLVLAAHGSVFNTITTRTFEESRTVLPPRQLCEEFDKVVGPFFRCVLASLRESRNLATLRDAILPLLVSGKVHVGDGLPRVAPVVESSSGAGAE